MTFDTISQASAATGLDRLVLEAARDYGTPAIRGGRTYCDELFPWLRANRKTIAAEISWSGNRLTTPMIDAAERRVQALATASAAYRRKPAPSTARIVALEKQIAVLEQRLAKLEPATPATP